MKKWALIFFLTLTAHFSYSQEMNQDWSEYETKVINPNNQNYIYLGYTDGGKKIRLLYYFQKAGKNVLAVNIGEKLVKELPIDSIDLFKLAITNKAELKKVRDNLINNVPDFLAKGIVLKQLGIRLKGLHCNHFLYTEPKLINEMPEGKLKKGLLLVNFFIEYLEKISQQDK